VGSASATDNCSDATVTYEGEVRTNGNCPNNYTLTRTWKAVDACGNTTFRSQTITITDTKAPTLTIPADASAECDDVPAVGSASATDNCSDATVTYEGEVRTNGNCPNNYTLTRTWKAVDACGNTSFKSQTITITDTKAPTLTIPADASAECDDVPAVGSASATDNCSDATVTYEGEVRTNGNCPNNYTLTRTWKAVDACGNTTTKSQVITVSDNTKPVLTVPADASAECDDVPAVGSASATDNCSDATVTYEGEVRTNGNCPNNYTLTRTWKAVDACGNTTFRSQTITITDTKAPTLTIPADASAECDDVPAVGSASATDNCSDATVTYEGEVRTNGNCPNNYTLTRTWKAVDACGNTTSFKSQTITITDTKAPTLTIPADASAECDDVPAVGSASATDNCSDATVTYEGEVRTNGNCPNNYTLTRTWKAVDACGNTTFRSQTITITDTKAPTLTIPADASAECDDVPAVGSASATDNCSDATVTYEGEVRTNGNCPNNYTLTRTWKAVDACGNTSFKSQTITITDTKAPTLTIPADASAECDDVPAVGSASATDNCSDATVTYEGEVRTNGNCPNNYTLTRTWKAVDACGNTTLRAKQSLSQILTAPTLTVPADASAECDDVPAVGSASATDNCSDATVTYEGEVRTNGNCPNNYTLTRTWKAVDACGNTTFRSQTITITDTKAPTLTGVLPGANIGNVCKSNAPAAPSTWVIKSKYADNCGSVHATLIGSGVTGTDAGWTATYTYSIIDDCGNFAANAVIVYTGADSENPVIVNCAPNQDVNLTNNCTLIVPNLVAQTIATDNCFVSVTQSPAAGTAISTAHGNTHTVTITASDAAGHSVTCAAILTAKDVTAPTLFCPAPVTATFNPAICGTIINGIDPSFSDNCAGAAVAYTLTGATTGNGNGTASGLKFLRGITTVKYCVTDLAGNKTFCSFNITVNAAQTASTLTVSSASVQYSDPVAMTVKVAGGYSPCGPWAATTVTFYVGGQDMGTAPFIQNGADIEASLTKPILQSLGTKTVSAVLNGTNTYYYTVNNPANKYLTVTCEDARATYTGAVYSSTSGSISSTATVTLSATIQDITDVLGDAAYDGNPGDILNATVKFINRDNNTVFTSAPLGLIMVGNNLVATATTNYTFNIGNSDAVQYTIGVIVEGYYCRNSSSDNTVITVSKPLNDFITGGGYLNLHSSAGLRAGDDNTKNNFGFNVKFNKNGTNLQGNINTIIRRTESDGLLHVYQIKGNAMTSLSTQNATSTAPAKATFNGKASIQDITDPLNVTGVDGNATLQVVMTDAGEPGTWDRIAITVWNKQGGMWYSSNWNGSATAEQLLGKGNLQINSSSPTIGSIVTTVAVSSTLNPSMIGQNVTFKAVINESNAAIPTGYATFADGTTILATVAVTTVSGITSASYTTSALSAGSHNIQVRYSGDNKFAASTGSMIQTVGVARPAPPILKLEIVKPLVIQAIPNPSTSYFNLRLKDGTKESVTIIITDQLGRVVEVIRNKSSGETVQLGSNYANGTYMVQAIQGDTKIPVKLIKQ
jgi:hypothetical protein